MAPRLSFKAIMRYLPKPISFSRLPVIAHAKAALLACLWLTLASSALAPAAQFRLPAEGGNVVGHIQRVTADADNTLLDVARHYDLGFNEITAANPGVSIWLPGAGTRIVVPTQFILPPKPWVGIVVDIPRRRLYYFPRHPANQPGTVITFPVGISRNGWPTPLGKTSIIAKFKDPKWIVPKDIQQEHQQEGQTNYPSYFPPGPDNPMGMLALQTGFPEIYIHGTDRPWGVGMRVSHGCVHLYPENAAYLFPRVPVGTPVRIIDQAVLVGERNHVLYLSVSKPIAGYPGARNTLALQTQEAIARFAGTHAGALPAIDWTAVRSALAARDIMPTPISAGAPTLAQEIAALTPTRYDFAPYGMSANAAAPPAAH